MMGRGHNKTKSQMGGTQKKNRKRDIDAQKSTPSSSSLSSKIQAVEKINTNDKVLTRNMLEMKTQNPSTSSSSSKNKKKRTLDKIEDGQTEKKLKEDSNFDSENQVEVEGISFMEQLPPEMLMKISKYLDVKSLTNCRLLNRIWNDIAREILPSRCADVEIRFDFCGNRYDVNRNRLEFYGNRWERASGPVGEAFEQFLKTFENSNEAPIFTRFRFDDITTSIFDHENWLKFTQDFGSTVRSLKLFFKKEYVPQDSNLLKLAKHLRHLLLNQLPNLNEFGLKFDFPLKPGPGSRKGVNIKLFSKPTSTSNEETTFQLPHLKVECDLQRIALEVLYLDKHSDSAQTGIVTDLQKAAVNLQKIEYFKTRSQHRRLGGHCCVNVDSESDN